MPAPSMMVAEKAARQMSAISQSEHARDGRGGSGQAQQPREAIADVSRLRAPIAWPDPPPHPHQQHRRQAERHERAADLGAIAGVDHIDRRIDEVHHPPAVAAERQHPRQHQARLGGEARHEPSGLGGGTTPACRLGLSARRKVQK